MRYNETFTFVITVPYREDVSDNEMHEHDRRYLDALHLLNTALSTSNLLYNIRGVDGMSHACTCSEKANEVTSTEK
jgi:hypothetical protein